MTADQLAAKWEGQADELAAGASGRQGKTYEQMASMRWKADQLRACAQELRQAGEEHADGITCPYCGKDSHVEIEGEEQELPCPECRQVLLVQFASYLVAS